MQTITFTPNPDDFMNPERGPMIRIYLVASEGSYWWVRENYNSTILKATPRLDDFSESDIPQTKLDEFQTQLDFIRSAGLKTILNFQYNSGGDDAPKVWILRHIEQLTPLLVGNADIITAMHMGFIGYFGEGHNSSNGLGNTQDRTDILFALLDALPNDRMILIRTPWWKWDIFQDVLDEARAFDGSNLARVGHQNTGWLGPQQGYPQGTYPHTPPTQQWIDNLIAESPYVPCDLEHSSITEFSNCINAVQWCEDVHADAVNKVWMPSVWDILEAEGCKDEILKNMGYRFVLNEATFPDQGTPGQDLSFEFKFQNEGYASFYNARSVLLVFRNATDRYDLEIVGLDPRWWLPGNHVINDFVSLPANMAEGDYEVSLWLPDAYDSIRDDPRYAVQFANQETWDDQLGLNILGQVTIGGIMSVITDLQAVEAALRAEAAAVIAQADAVAQSILDLKAVDDVLDVAADVIEED